MRARLVLAAVSVLALAPQRASAADSPNDAGVIRDSMRLQLTSEQSDNASVLYVDQPERRHDHYYFIGGGLVLFSLGLWWGFAKHREQNSSRDRHE